MDGSSCAKPLIQETTNSVISPVSHNSDFFRAGFKIDIKLSEVQSMSPSHGFLLELLPL